MQFQEIDLTHRQEVERMRALACHKASSHAFASLYLWRKAMGASVFFSDNCFVVKCREGYFFPCGAREEAAALVKELLTKEPDACFLYAHKEDVALCNELFGVSAEATFDAPSREYVYMKEEQIAMSGKRFTYQRAKVNKARRLGEIVSQPLTDALLPEARRITEAWAERRGEDKGDFDETMEALDCFHRLSLAGNMLFVNGSAVGFNLGSFISEDTFDIHIAKTLSDDVDTLMKLELYKTLPESVVYINREEDLGIKGLAMHKQDAQPCSFNDTYRISLRRSLELK